MKIEITGSRCVTCSRYTQYYQLKAGQVEAIDCGFCGAKQRHVRPGDRCKKYSEKSNVGFVNCENVKIV